MPDNQSPLKKYLMMNFENRIECLGKSPQQIYEGLCVALSSS